MIANGTEITYKAGGTTCTVDQEQALNTSTGGFRGRCSKGGQVGHKRMFAGMTICQEIVENMETKVSDVREIWLGDSGASSHITNSKFGMKNTKECKVQVTVSTGETTLATLKGDIDMVSENGEKFRLKDVLYVPSLYTETYCPQINSQKRIV